jgi:hypothetical protein
MNQELIEMARRAGIDIGMWEKLFDDDDVFGYDFSGMHENLEAFAALVAAAEREACAKLVEPKNPRPCDCTSCDCGNSGDLRAVVEWDAAIFNANLIRARGETK